MVASAMGSEQILGFESVDLELMRSSSVLLLLNFRQLFVIHICKSGLSGHIKLYIVSIVNSENEFHSVGRCCQDRR